MRALVVYDSFYGNTEQVARAIGNGLGAEAEVRRVTEVQPGSLAGLDLLIVGSPTRAFRPSPATTSFLKGITAGGLSGIRVAAFDTRVAVEDTGPAILRSMAKLFGYAAKPIADLLTKKGGDLAAPPEGFYVRGSEGPPKEGELERAATWAKQVAAAR